VALGTAVGRAVRTEVAALAVLAALASVGAGADDSGTGVGGALAQPATSRQAMRASHSIGCRLTF